MTWGWHEVIIILRQINFALFYIACSLYPPPLPNFWRQARNSCFSFLSIMPRLFSENHIQYYFWVSSCYFPSHITPKIAYLPTQEFNDSRLQFLNRIPSTNLTQPWSRPSPITNLSTQYKNIFPCMYINISPNTGTPRPTLFFIWTD